MIGRGTGDYMQPHAGGGCATCTRFGRWASTVTEHGRAVPVIGGAVWCAKHQFVNGQPKLGCPDWIREPGTDDELNCAPRKNIAPDV